MLIGATFDDIFFHLVHKINRYPQFVSSPRGQKVRESLVVSFELTNPRARLLSVPARKADYGFAVGEFLWYWTGKRDLESLLYYNKRAAGFSNDGLTVNSAYGYRLRRRSIFSGVDEQRGLGQSQWETCIETLANDPDSRRAVMLINLPEDEREAVDGSKDVPCTMSLQFFIRRDEAMGSDEPPRLHLHTLMRSNDVMWGLTYDLFSFTLFQECMLMELKKLPQFLDLELGSYVHTAGSMHIYERHFEQAGKIIQEYVDSGFERQPPMRPLEFDDLGELASIEECLRTGKEISIFPDDLSKGGHWMADRLKDHRAKRDREKLANP